MSPDSQHDTDGKKPFSISLRLKVMASTIVVVIPIMALIGWKAQEITWDQAVSNHERQITFQLSQFGKDHVEAFDSAQDPEASDDAASADDDPRSEAVKLARREMAQAMNEMVGNTSARNGDGDGRQGVVFVAAFDQKGSVLHYTRSPGYMGELYNDLLEFGQARRQTTTDDEEDKHETLARLAEEIFSPLSQGRLMLSESAITHRETVAASGNSGLQRRKTEIGRVVIGHTTQPLEAEFAQVSRRIWFWIAGIGVFAAVLTWLATQTIVRPIYQLIQGTQRVAKGDYAHSVQVKTRDELAQLADSFNFMRGELRHTLQELDRQNRNLESIVRHRTRKLRAAYEELQVLDKMKDGFLSSISHEFRTPITSIKAFIEILTCEEGLNEDQHEFLGIIKTEADRLGGLVNDVLDLVKIENGEMPFTFTEIDPAVPLKGAIDAQRDRITESNIQLDVQFAEQLPDVNWDTAKVTRVVHELLGNAIRFSESGGAVEMSVAPVDGMIEFRVRDHGPGIPPNALEEVFKKFRQMGEVLTDKPTGTGLGLPICRQIAQRHGGTLHAETPEGPGALIVLRLPLEPPAEPVKAPPVVTEADMESVFA